MPARGTLGKVTVIAFTLPESAMPRPVLITLTALAASLFFAGAASAQSIVPKLDQEGRKGDMARLAKQQAVKKFDAADVDKDGQLSRKEAAEASPYLAENFDKRDLNQDGFISWEEYVGHDRWPKSE